MNARKRLEDHARELGCFPDPENYTDTQLLDAIKAEQAAGVWLDRLEQLPTGEAKRDAVHRLGEGEYTCPQCGEEFDWFFTGDARRGDEKFVYACPSYDCPLMGIGT